MNLHYLEIVTTDVAAACTLSTSIPPTNKRVLCRGIARAFLLDSPQRYRISEASTLRRDFRENSLEVDWINWLGEETIHSGLST